MSSATHFTRILLCLVLALGAAGAQSPPVWQPALDHISAASLRGHLSFLASDLLEGRNTPSRGLDLAAAYIAAQFRRAGLEPAAGDDYLQTADMLQLEPDTQGFEMKFQHGDQTLTVSREHAVPRTRQAIEFTELPVVRVSADNVDSLSPEQVKGRAIVLDTGRGYRRLLAAVQKLEPAVIVRLVRAAVPVPPAQLIEAEERPSGAPVISISHDETVRALRELKPGLTDWKLTLRAAAERETPVKASNVIGLLRGSDPALADTYVLLTAHYDHLGLTKSGEDRVYNGANDNASGTVSVIEIANALAALPQSLRPKRSIVFMTFFGEEEGLLGSLYYTHHPVFPLAKTVANINLEQLGRTDAGEGPEIASLTFTGMEFSDIPNFFRKAGAQTGVQIYEAPNGGNEFFNRSDNLSFADHGIPSHTAVVAVDFPDYHAPGDEWQKIDYPNLATIDRALALGLLLLADEPHAPHWNAEKAGRYAGAQP
jgi:hypothetical protein